MKRLHISEVLSLPAEVITQTFAVLAMRRVGKTYTASVMAEEMIKAKLPFVALDPTGAWWGLRSSADGKRPGYPVIIIGGEHGDLPLEATAGKVLADLVVDHPGYYVLDMSSTLSNAEQDRIATDFAERLYRRKANAPFPLHLFVDEADAFIPQRPFPNQTKMLGAFEALVRRGGIRGIGLTMITQRPAVINKNVLTQCDNLIVMRITGPQDRAAIDEWVKGNGTKEQRDELVDSLASLQKGDAWIWSPATLDLFERVHIRERETFNSSATPEVGSSRVEPRELAPVDLEALRDKIADTIEKAKQDDPKELRREIAELKRELSRKVEPVPAKAERIEVPVIDHSTMKNLKDALLALEDQAQQVISALGEVRTALIKADIGNHPLEKAGQQTEKRIHARNSAQRVDKRPARRILALQSSRAVAATQLDLTISSTQQRILDAIAFYESISINEPSNLQVGAIALIDATGGHFSNTVGPLSSSGLVERGNGRMRLTEAGRAVASVPDNIADLDDYHNMLRARVRRARSASGRTIDMLDAIIAKGGSEISTEEIGQVIGIDHTGGHFSNTIGPLSTLGLIVRRDGWVRPTEILFPPGLN